MAFPFLAFGAGLLGMFVSSRQQSAQRKLTQQQTDAQKEILAEEKRETEKKRKAAEGMTILPIGRQVAKFPLGLSLL